MRNINNYYVAWITLNVVGASLYLFLASQLWVANGEEGTPGGPGDVFYWVFTLVPLLVLFFICNCTASIFAFRKTKSAGRKHFAYILILLTVIWLLVLIFDHGMATRYINAEFA